MPYLSARFLNLSVANGWLQIMFPRFSRGTWLWTIIDSKSGSSTLQRISWGWFCVFCAFSWKGEQIMRTVSRKNRRYFDLVVLIGCLTCFMENCKQAPFEQRWLYALATLAKDQASQKWAELKKRSNLIRPHNEIRQVMQGKAQPEGTSGDLTW